MTEHAEMPAALFVYGSLLRAINHPMGQRLAAEADFVGAATINARLYRVSWYPAAQPSTDPQDVLHGEVFRMRTPAATLSWLDAYEGVTQDPTSAAEPQDYYRDVAVAELAPVNGRVGSSIRVLVYFWRPERPESTRVLSGSWILDQGS